MKTREHDELKFSVWSRQWESGLDTDYAGNYIYGYVGKGYLGTLDFYLKGAAGTAQLLSDKKTLNGSLVWNTVITEINSQEVSN